MSNYPTDTELHDEEQDCGFSMISHALLAAIELKPTDKIIFQFLKSCQSGFKPSYSAIQTGLGHLGKNTVIRSIKNLQKYNLLTIEQVEWRGRKKNIYTLKSKKSWQVTYSVARAGIEKNKVVPKMEPTIVPKMEPTIVPKKGTLEEQPRRTTKKNNNSSSKENKTTTIKKVADLCEENMASDGWYSYKNAIKIYEHLGESKFVEFLEYANYLNHYKKSDYKRTFGNVERAISSFNGR